MKLARMATGTVTAAATATAALGGMTGAASATNCKLITFGLTQDAFISHDLTYRLSLPDDLTVTASVLNALDTEPPRARIELSYDPFIGNPLGRTFKVGVRKKF